MQFWSWTIAVILGLSAIVSPIVTAIINNCHQTKIKKIEIYELSKQNSLTKFINDFSLYFSNPSDSTIRNNALSSMHSLLIYFDIEDTLQLKILESFNQQKNKLLNEVIIELSKQIKKN